MPRRYRYDPRTARRVVINESEPRSIAVTARRKRRDAFPGTYLFECETCGTSVLTDMRSDLIRRARAHDLGCRLQGGPIAGDAP